MIVLCSSWINELILKCQLAVSSSCICGMIIFEYFWSLELYCYAWIICRKWRHSVRKTLNLRALYPLKFFREFLASDQLNRIRTLLLPVFPWIRCFQSAVYWKSFWLLNLNWRLYQIIYLGSFPESFGSHRKWQHSVRETTFRICARFLIQFFCETVASQCLRNIILKFTRAFFSIHFFLEIVASDQLNRTIFNTMY